VSDEPIDADELAFAQRLAAQEPDAVAQFEARYLDELRRSLSAMRLDDATLDEVRQRVRERLLLPGADGQPRVLAYAGRGRLEGLVHVTASRIAVDLLRARRATDAKESPAAVDALEAADLDPSIAAAKREVSAHFREAFSSAVDALDPRQRNVLKLHLLRGVTLEKLAEMYSVHRATVVRWLADARATVLASTRRALASRVGPAEVDDALGTLESQLDASVERLFRTRE
jgi:RNA polymerase sigma-70 factor (ECF subfamily)